MRIMFLQALLGVVYGLSSSANFIADRTSEPQVCYQQSLEGVKWILESRQSDGGWKGDTAKATIALAVSRFRGSKEEMSIMERQLEKVITNALLKNTTSVVVKSDLALYINALIASKRNPRNFNGVDLVIDLLHRVQHEVHPHPYLVLALCNAHAIEMPHLDKIQKYLDQDMVSTRDIELKALALKAFACAATSLKHSRRLELMQPLMEIAAESLAAKHSEKISVDVYTTSLIVQALTAYGRIQWDEEIAISFLRKESEEGMNMVKAYYIEMGLNARRVKFIKDLYDGSYEPEQLKIASEITITLTIMHEKKPARDFSVIISISSAESFHEAMAKASELSNRFYFNSNPNQEVYQIGQEPNDAELNVHWHVCRRNSNEFQFSTSARFVETSMTFQPVDGDHIVLWYGSSDCPP